MKRGVEKTPLFHIKVTKVFKVLKLLKVTNYPPNSLQ